MSFELECGVCGSSGTMIVLHEAKGLRKNFVSEACIALLVCEIFVSKGYGRQAYPETIFLE